MTRPMGNDCLKSKELERQAFQLNILLDTVRELSQLPNLAQFMQRFLLMGMGAMGAAQGFVFLCSEGQKDQVAVASRGLADADADRLRQNASELRERYLAKNPFSQEILPHQARVVGYGETPVAKDLPREIEILVEWAADQTCFGLLGFGRKISQADYDDEDEDFLLRLVSVFMDALEPIRADAAKQRFTAAMFEKNRELELALEQARSMQRDLDRRYFHFKSLCDATRELSGNLDRDSLCTSFLLSVMGIFSAQKGFIVVWDRQSSAVQIVARGYPAGGAPRFSCAEMESIFRELLHPSFLPAKGERRQLLLTPEQLAALALPGKPVVAVAFIVGETQYGLICLGRALQAREDPQSEHDLLQALVQHFLVNLGNAHAFQTIQHLNQDLVHMNQELRQTLDELQESRQTITLLEAARQRISSLLQLETRRIKRVTVWDFFAIGVVSLLLALVFNAASPGGIPLTPETWAQPRPQVIDVTWAELKHAAQGALFLDARPVEFFNQERIAGAENLPLSLFDFVYSMKFSQLDPDQNIIVYGRNISRHYDEIVAAKLMERGMENVRVLAGGLQKWKRRGLPVEP